MTTKAETEVRSLHRKLAEVMVEAERIPKNGTAPAAMGGFKFAQVGDAADAIRKALGTRGVSMLPTTIEIVGQTEHATKSGGTMTTVELRITWTLTDADTGETAVIQSYGVGADTGDKYSGKAASNAMKYALLVGFLLSTGEDVELSDTSDRRARRDTIADAAVARQGIVSGPPAWDTKAATYDAGLIGVAKVGKNDADFETRQTPDGPRVAFSLTDGTRKIKAIALGDLAELLGAHRPAIEGQRVTAWGRIDDETYTAKPTKPGDKPFTNVYQVLTLSRLKVGDLDLSEPDRDEGPTEEEREEMADLAFPVTA